LVVTKRADSVATVERVANGLREILLLSYLALSLYLFLALLTFDAQDPGWRHTGSGHPISNLGGPIGAWIADFTLTWLGVMAFLLPAMLAWHGLLLYRLKAFRVADWKILALRWLGCSLTAAAGCGLFYVHFVWLPLGLPETNGGILGVLLGDWLLRHIGPVGATLALLVGFLCGATLFTGLSWFALMGAIGKRLLGGWDWVAQQSRNCKFLLQAKAVQTQKEKRKLKSTPSLKVASHPARGGLEKPVTTPTITDSKTTFANLPSAVRGLASPKVETASQTAPPLEFLDRGEEVEFGYSEEELKLISQQVEEVLIDFGVQAEVKEIHPGPVVTRFEVKPSPGIKGSKISNLSTDLARSLSVPSVRVVEVIPGKSYVGLEVPNRKRQTVYLREILESCEYQQMKSPVSLALGKDIAGHPVVADLAKMPHLLVAGTTGSGKSVAINAMILSMLYKAQPQEVRLIMIDPKMLELSVYEGIPHLLSPVVTDMKEAASALRWCVAEMERRYRLMSTLKVRNLLGYNRKVQEAIELGEPLKDPLFRAEKLGEGETWPCLAPMPIIVVVIDELADMMMVAGKKVEELIARLAQKARAAGIHLILATQRPSVDVLTGLIKANIPTRIAFQVSSKIDSRTILDQSGAEALLGCGDMLYLPPGSGFPIRVHGAFVADHEVLKIVEYLRQLGPPNYLEEITRFQEEAEASGENGGEGSGETDPLYDSAVRFVIETRRVSISSIQRKFKIGYNRAARIVEDMERAGIVSSAEGNGARSVLVPLPED
jgi:S-DNA-T family DNA segregation ATPase FtsK/SpoIIIE